MRSLLAAYNRDLKAKAQAASPAKRLNVVYAAMSPWCLLALIASLVVTLLHLPRGAQEWVILPALCIAAVGASYAGSRIAKYGWEHDRTPPAAAWIETEAGKALIQALRRVTLNGLSEVTGATRLRAHLKLTYADVAQLYSILQGDRWLDREAPVNPQSDPSVDELVSRMSHAGSAQRPASVASRP